MFIVKGKISGDIQTVSSVQTVVPKTVKIVTPYSQKDPRWSNVKIGYTSLTLGKCGCLITCISMLDGQMPDKLNFIFTNGKCFIDADGVLDSNLLDDYLLISNKAARLLGYTYNYQKTKPDFNCIAETNHYKKLGYPQHFFVLLKNGNRLDPLDVNPSEEKNNYNIVSYRIWSSKVV